MATGYAESQLWTELCVNENIWLPVTTLTASDDVPFWGEDSNEKETACYREAKMAPLRLESLTRQGVRAKKSYSHHLITH